MRSTSTTKGYDRHSVPPADGGGQFQFSNGLVQKSTEKNLIDSALIFLAINGLTALAAFALLGSVLIAAILNPSTLVQAIVSSSASLMALIGFVILVIVLAALVGIAAYKYVRKIEWGLALKLWFFGGVINLIFGWILNAVNAGIIGSLAASYFSIFAILEIYQRRNK